MIVAKARVVGGICFTAACSYLRRSERQEPLMRQMPVLGSSVQSEQRTQRDQRGKQKPQSDLKATNYDACVGIAPSRGSGT